MSRIIAIVANPVVGDSRVQKMARSAAAAGHDVILVGRSTSADADGWELGGARVERVPVAPVISGYEARRRRRPSGQEHAAYLHARLLVAEPGSLAARWWALRMRHAGLDRLAVAASTGPLGGLLWRAATLIRGAVGRHGGWRALNPWLRDLEAALAPVLGGHEPDLLHAHDHHTLGIAVRAARRSGRRVPVVYDCHELLTGVVVPRVWDVRGRLRRRMLAGAEREHIRQAAAVVTVSPELARLLQREHQLAQPPLVVQNAPQMDASRETPVGVRASVGLDDATPLAVYGGGLSPRRGLGTVLEALPELPSLHVALVCREDDPDLAALLSHADRLGLADRVHPTPYVDPLDVSAHLASADLGLVPIQHHPNHEISLITKWLEYAHARLPLVVSDVRVMAAETRRLGVGEVFRAGDAADLARALSAVLADPGRYRMAWDDHEELLRELSWDRQVTGLLQLYSRLLVQA